MDGIISGWMNGGLEGWREGWKGGASYPGDSSKEDRMSETRRKKKKEDVACPFLSMASVRAVKACLLFVAF